MSQEKETKMSEDLKSWGIGLIILAVLHFIIPALSAEWGVVLIPLGILVMVFKHRGMFIVIGGILILVGLLNILASLEYGGHFWLIFGGMQIYWGIKEITKFSIYREKYEQENTVLESQNSVEKMPEQVKSCG